MIKKILIIFLSIILVIVLTVSGLGIYVFCSLNDRNDKTLQSVRDNDYPLMYLVNREMDESTRNIDTTNEMNFSLNEENLNEFLYAFVSKLEIPHVTIRGAYCCFLDNGGINVEIPIKVKGISSVLKAGLKIENDNGTFKFTLLNAKVGKLNATSGIIKRFILSNISSDELTTSLNEKKVYCEVSVENLSVTFTEGNLVKTFKEIMKNDSNVDVYALLIDFLLTHENILSFELGENKTVGFDFHLNDIQYEETRDDIIREPLALDQCKTSTLHVSEMDYTNVSALFQYYVTGYDSLSDSDKEKVNALHLSHAEKGVKSNNERDMLDVINDQAPKSLLEWNQAILDKKLSINITEVDFAKIFCTMDFIGKSFAFGVDTSSLMYLTFESLSLDIKDDYFYINLILNVSGKRIIVKAECTAEESTTGTIDAIVKSISLGSVKLDEKYIPILLNYLDDCMKDESWFTTEPDKSMIHLNLQDLVLNYSSFDKLKEHEWKSKMIFEDSSDGNGLLKLTYTL